MVAINRRRTAALASFLALWLTIGIGLSAESVAGSGTYRDDFDAISFSGSNGSLGWASNWVEGGEADGASAGRAQVTVDSRCLAGGCGYLSAGGATTAALRRGADLAGATSATLTFSHRRTKVGNNAGLIRVSVSSNGGSSWATMATYPLDVTDAAQANKTFNILTFASAQTQIRFQVESTPGQSGRYYFDAVQISATFPDPTTTTTTTTAPPTTTTNPPTTTTTSAPGSTTTTSTPPGGTTQPPITATPTTSIVVTTSSPPTSTLPPGPTTTVGGPTTTAVPGGSTTTTLIAAPPVDSGGSGGFPVFPVAALPRGTAAPFLVPAIETVDPDVTGLVRVGTGSELISAAQTASRVSDGEGLPLGAPSTLSLAWPTLVAITLVGLASRLRKRQKARFSPN